MTKFILEIELKYENKCTGCFCLDENDLIGFNCLALDNLELQTETPRSENVVRPKECKLKKEDGENLKNKLIESFLDFYLDILQREDGNKAPLYWTGQLEACLDENDIDIYQFKNHGLLKKFDRGLKHESEN